MDTVRINVSKRELRGKGGARASRRAGRVPGILYGPDENVALAVDHQELDRVLRSVSSGNAILDLSMEGRESEDIKAIIKEVQRHPVTEAVVHFDLEHIRMDQRVRVHVPLHLIGTPAGVKEGGILEHLARDIELDCVAAKIPASIDVDVTNLERNESIHVRDLALDPDMHVMNPPDQVVAMVVSPATETEEKPAEGGATPASGTAAPAE